MEFLKSRKVSSADLEIGMYIADLDRPWLETPFAIQGFTITTEDELTYLQEHCEYVYVDEKSYLSANYSDRHLSSTKKSPAARKQILQKDFKRPLKPHSDTVSWKEEFPQAKKAVAELTQHVERVFKEFHTTGALDVAKVKLAVDPMIESVSRNPEACLWLARMKQEDQYTYQHSLAASIWAVALGRQLGLPKSDLRSLAVGGLLFDVGKLQLDQEILHSSRRLTEEEFETVKSHVTIGLEAIKGADMINSDIVDMIEHHHERYNGNGYPQGLKRDKIPVFARIAAIVDCYDAITSQRPYARAMPPAIAIKKLYEWRDIDFQAELVEEFIQAIGIYPAGSLVELTTGEVAIVIAEYRSRRLRPQVMLLLDADKKPLPENPIIDLLEVTETEDGQPMEIVSSLEPEAYGINMQSIQL